MAKKNNTQTSGFRLQPVAILQGFFFTLVLLLFISISLAVVVYFSSWQASPKLLNLLAHLGVLGGAILAGRRCDKKAWCHGILVGVLAFLFLSWIGSGEVLVTWLWAKSLLKMGIVAMLGGILGGLLN